MRLNQNGFSPVIVIMAATVAVTLSICAYFILSVNGMDDDKATVPAPQKAQEAEVITQEEEPSDEITMAANDNKRKADLVRLISKIAEFYAVNNGKYPSTDPTEFTNTFKNNYVVNVLENFTDPKSKIFYTIAPVTEDQTAPELELGTIQYKWPAKCGDGEFVNADSGQQAAVRLLLESGEIYCLTI